MHTNFWHSWLYGAKNKTERGQGIDIGYINQIFSAFKWHTDSRQLVEIHNFRTHPWRWHHRCIVDVYVMLDKGFRLVAFQLFIDMLAQFLMNIYCNYFTIFRTCVQFENILSPSPMTTPSWWTSILRKTNPPPSTSASSPGSRSSYLIPKTSSPPSRISERTGRGGGIENNIPQALFL